MAKIVIILVFTTLFLSFVALLVCLALFAYDETKDAHRDPPLSASRPIVHYDTDWAEQLNLTCGQCPPTTLLSIFCDPRKFAIVVDLVDSQETNDIDVQLFRFSRIRVLKSLPNMIEALTSKVIGVRASTLPDERCEHTLLDGRRYLVKKLCIEY